MKELVLFTLIGLGAGSLISGLSLSVILTYRGSGVINIAAGGFAMEGAYLYYAFKTGGLLHIPAVSIGGLRIALDEPWSTAPALVTAIVLCGLTGLVVDRYVFRRLRTASPLSKLIATLGLLLFFQAVVLLWFGVTSRSAPAVLPSKAVSVFGVAIPRDRFIFAAIVVVVAVALTVGYRYSRFGLATRAASEDEAMAMRTGLSPDRLSTMNTVLGSVLAGALGILFAPVAQLDTTTIALTIVPALAAALMARFTSFGVAAVTGFGMGVLESLVTWAQTTTWFPSTAGGPLPGVTDLLFFLIIGLVLYFRGQVLPERGMVAERRLPAAPHATYILRPTVIVSAVVVVGLLTLPFGFRQALINTLIGTVVCLSLVVITGFVGQISLIQLGLAGVSALVLTKLTASSGIGFPIAPLLGVALAVVVGVLTALPTMRIRGVSLAIITMAGAVAIANFWLSNANFGFDTLNGKVGSPHLLGLDLGPNSTALMSGLGSPSPLFGFLCLVCAAGAAMFVAALRRGNLGQRMLAVRSNERAAAAAGINVRETKLVAYAISSGLAGLAGALYAYSFQTGAASDYSISIALSFVAFAYMGGITTVSGAIVGGMLCTEAFLAHVGEVVLHIPANWQLVLAGFALVVTMIKNPNGIATSLALSRPGRLVTRVGRPLPHVRHSMVKP